MTGVVYALTGENSTIRSEPVSAVRDVVLIGASVRALAGSALRAGLSPFAIDLFADVDLQTLCPTVRLTGWSPEAILEAVQAAPPGPWMYTGGLENHPQLLERLAAERPCWGVVGSPLRAVRCHTLLNERLHRAGVTVPRQHIDRANPPERGTWLVKPRCGAGGRGIRVHDPAEPLSPEALRTCYLQQRVSGVPTAAVFLGDGARTRLLGLTMQLIGTTSLGAKSFQYAGSIGPLPVTPGLEDRLRRLGHILGQRSGLRGLFGVDGVMRNDHFWPVEVNPRYTASMEVIEFATGQHLVAAHRQVFDRTASVPGAFVPAGPCVGKAILYAPHDTTFPDRGPWSATLAAPPSVGRLPAFADIPAVGSVLLKGQPVLTALVVSLDVEACLASIQQAVKSVLDVLPTGS